MLIQEILLVNNYTVLLAFLYMICLLLCINTQ